MTQHHQCPHCHNTHLLRIGVRGIRQCAQCHAYVDIRRSKGWLKQWLASLAA
ncbi:MAG TPA: transposase [Leptolyngbyaceae cyanobacterium M65_K2018_010]|nr:transposase [Leptolyngbyaceae cyanobacterium M65_K2018_010]